MSPEATRPATRSRENTRARLLAAAAEVFGEVGLAAASVEAVCERAGFTRGAFYSNFDSKDELFLELVQRSSSEKLDQVAGRVRELDRTASVDPAFVVRAVVGASLEGLQPRLVCELRAQSMRDERMAAAYLRLQDGIVARVRAIIADVADTYRLELRMSVDQTARLMVDIAIATSERAEIEGMAAPAATEMLHVRLEALATALVVD